MFDRYRTSPEQTAVVLRLNEGETALTVRQLVDGALGYAARLRQAGIAPGEVVIALLPPGAELLHAFLGAMFLGAIPSILPFLTEKLDPQRYRESLDSLISVTRPAALIAEPDLADVLRTQLAHASEVKAMLASDAPGVDLPPIDTATLEGLRAAPDSLALLQHSSGTTGLQKGVALSHRAILRQLAAYTLALGLTPSDIIVSWLPLYHDMGLIAGFLMPVLTGAKLVLLSPFEWARAPWTMLRAVSEHGGTLAWLPNFAYNFCATRIPDRELNGLDLSSWRAVINCSEPMVAESHRLFSSRLRPFGLSETALATCYAMAENVFAVTQGGIDRPVRLDRVDREMLVKQGRAVPAGGADRRTTEVVSAGEPLANCEVRVLSPDGTPLPQRQIGELVLRSDCMLTGYFNRPDATASALREGWYLTGDLGYLAEGEVFITGRKKDLMIVGGKNIYPQDIEYLINQVPGVHPGRVVVFGLFNESMGTEEPAAVVEVDPAVRLEANRLGLAIREAVATGSEVTLGPLKLVDERWLVKTSSGKIARGANREKLLAELGREA
jgi:acyl-CoA synthetase (AMP-forming)/AMP-acid ligase II